MPVNNLIDRGDAGALIPEEHANEIIKLLPENSVALTRFRQVRMSRKQFRMPVLSALPLAYFVNGDSGLKETTEVAWDNKYLNAEPLAVIVPIPEDVLDDADYDMWGEIKPLIAEAFGRKIDGAVFFDVDKPATWGDAIVDLATSAGNAVTRGTNAASKGGLAGDISDLFSKAEVDGFDVNFAVAHRRYKGLLRQTRNQQGDRHYEVDERQAYGVEIDYPLRGLWPTGAGEAEMVVGDSSQGVIGLRADIHWKILEEAVISDSEGKVVLNLAQQDSVALRAVMRVAWEVPNPINHDQPTEEDRYPFAVLNSPAS